MKILIVGCGYLGKSLGSLLVSRGNEVWGLARDVSGVEDLGIKPFAADLLKRETLVGLPQVDFVVAAQAPSRKEDDYYRTYVEGTRNLVEAIKDKKVKRLILISSTRVYGSAKGDAEGWVDEFTTPEPDDDSARSLLESEKNALDGIVPAVVFRLGGIYGPGRNRVDAIRSGKLVPEFSDAYVNRIHVEDAVRGIELLIEKGEVREVYLGVDDLPSTQREFYTWLLDRLNLKNSEHKKLFTQKTHKPSNKKCSNRKLKKLGFQLKYPDYIRGYYSIIL